MGKWKEELEDWNIRYDVAVIHLLKVSFVDSRAALPRLAESSEPADTNRDHLSSKWASFPFTRNLSIIWAWPIRWTNCLANDSEQRHQKSLTKEFPQ